MTNGVSIIICCYNSAWVISKTLNGLKNQIIPDGLPWEIILVDNCCTDNTVEIAENTMQDSKIDFTIIHEPTPGLAYARRTGIEKAKYSITIYCDDDNVLCPEYLSTMYGIMMSDDKIGAAGGKGVAEFCAEPEDDVLRRIGGYAIGSQRDGRKDWLYGAGVTLRTKLVREVYNTQKCHMIGRKGSLLLSGDDSELVMSMVNRGYKIYPTDDVYYTHVLKAERLTNEYCQKLNEGFVLPSYAFESMRAAIYETGFRIIAGKYRRLWQNYFKYCIIRWKPWSKIQREISMRDIKNYNYWGIFNLYKIYREWKEIHDKYKKLSSM